MKKVNLLSKAEMKQVKGGLDGSCSYGYVACQELYGNPSTTQYFPNVCCTSLLDARDKCIMLGFTPDESTYECVGSID